MTCHKDKVYGGLCLWAACFEKSFAIKNKYMKAGYRIEHNWETNCLGEQYRIAVINNYHRLNEVGITYWEKHDLSHTENNKVAIFRLRLKPLTTNEKIAK